nr:unnamed protein product [Callosobruchus chinensis]
MEYPREPPPPYSPTAPPFPGVHQVVKSSQLSSGPPPTTIYGHPSYGATQATDTIIIQPPPVVIVGKEIKKFSYTIPVFKDCPLFLLCSSRNHGQKNS